MSSMLEAMARYAQTEQLPVATLPRVENRYCQPCMMTTRHQIKAPIYTCLRCNAEKRRVTPARG